MKILKFLIVLTFSVCVTNAQPTVKPAEAYWTRIETEDKDLSVSFPPGFIIDAEKRDADQRYKIVGFRNGVLMELRMVRESSPKTRLRNVSFADAGDAFEFTMGEFEAKRNKSKASDENFFESIYLASRKNFYHIQVRARRKDAFEIKRFLHSLKINGKRLFTSSVSQNLPEESVSVTALKTSPEIVEAFERKPRKNQITVTKNRGAIPDRFPDYEKYSRPPIVVEKPNPYYRPPASRIMGGAPAGGAFSADLKVTFLATGQIGDITVYSNSDSAFVDACVEAAKKIRFIPAQSGGVNVDSAGVVNYSLQTFVSVTPAIIAVPGQRPF